MERCSKVVIAESRLVAAFGGFERIYQECPEPLGPPWRLHVSGPTDLVVSSLFVGMIDLFNPRHEFRPIVSGEMMEVSRTGVAANVFAGNGPGLPMHGPTLDRGAVIAIDLFNPWASAQEAWVSLWGTLP